MKKLSLIGSAAIISISIAQAAPLSKNLQEIQCSVMSGCSASFDIPVGQTRIDFGGTLPMGYTSICEFSKFDMTEIYPYLNPFPTPYVHADYYYTDHLIITINNQYPEKYYVGISIFLNNMNQQYSPKNVTVRCSGLG